MWKTPIIARCRECEHRSEIMKQIVGLSIAVLLLSVGSLIAVGNIFLSVKAESRGEEIIIEWNSGGEAGFHTFEIERKSNEVPTYRRIGQIVAKGDNGSYRFVDNGAFYKSDGDKEFTYRVKAVGSGLEQYSPPVTVSHQVVSSVKRSWGMIKELFR